MVIVHDVVVNTILEGSFFREVVKPYCIGFILAKKRLRLAICKKIIGTEFMMVNFNNAFIVPIHFGSIVTNTECPSIAKPSVRKNMEISCFGSMILNSDFNKDVMIVCFCVLNKNIEVPVVIKNSGVN